MWGVNHIVSGWLRYRIDGLNGRETLLEPARPDMDVPEVLRQVDPDGPMRFFVGFHRDNG
ncbi:hypothetical protein BE15_02330 [Sorangium cellulosum]|uniref:Uncharacterized protein n=1 Tax=Sorangium cellulosum TaxID=56 RepID=A0A150QBB8_SORCE|nr:hypothetical protein BE15_02330 [Sorangium cellulosum]